MILMIFAIVILIFIFWCIEAAYNNGTIDGYNAHKYPNDNLDVYIKIRERMNNENT